MEPQPAIPADYTQQYNYYSYPQQNMQYPQHPQNYPTDTHTNMQENKTLPQNNLPQNTNIQTHSNPIQQITTQPANNNNNNNYHPPQDKYIQSPLDSRIHSFLSSTNPNHKTTIHKFKKIIEGKERTSSRRSLSHSSEHISDGFCKVPPFQEFAGIPAGININY